MLSYYESWLKNKINVIVTLNQQRIKDSKTLNLLEKGSKLTQQGPQEN